MKFRAPRAELASAAADAARAVPPRPPVPTLNTLLVEATEDGEVTITGFDFDTCIRATCGADVEEPGRVLVPGRPFPAFLAAMPSGEVTVTEEAARVALSMPKVRYRLATLDPFDYPALPPVPEAVGSIDAAEFVRAVGRVAACARPLDGLSWAGSLRLAAGPDGLELFATDRFTVGHAWAPWLAGGPAEPVTAELPAKTLTDALRGMSGEVTLGIDAGGVAVLGAERTTITRRSDIEYPDCRRVLDGIPPAVARLRVRADELAGAMTRAGKVLAGGPGSIRLHVTDESISYEVTSESESELVGELDHLGVEGTVPDLHVNAVFLADSLKAFGPEVVELAVYDPKRAVLVTAPTVPGLRHIFMPVRPAR